MMLIFVLAFLTGPLTCRAIHSDSIAGRDLAQAIPAFSKLPPDLPLSPSPVPGQQRIFHPAELRHIAAANHIAVEPASDLCFEWQVKVPARDALMQAMQTALSDRKPTIEILDQSLMPVPDGKIVFPLSGMSGISDRPIIWRGYVEYATSRRFPIWVRAAITVTEPRVLAVSALKPGDIISPSDVRVETYQGAVGRETGLSEISAATGMIVRRQIPAGAPIYAYMLERPRDVERGQLVSVTVQAGAAIIQAQGMAEQSGHRGDIINIRNPQTGKIYHARVQDKGTVVVVPGGAFGLVGDDRKS